MATAADIIKSAFSKVAIYDATASQTAEALTTLNRLISVWGIEYLQPFVVRESFAVSSGDAEYTIGSGGDLDTVRPSKIVSLILRDSDGYDHPLDPISSSDYARISGKSTTARPERYYFVPEYPLAKIIFESQPDANYTAYIESLKPFTEFAATTSTLSAPPEYREAIVYNLAVAIGEDWNRVIPASVIRTAERLKDLIATFIAGLHPVSRANFDSGFGGRGRRSNIYEG